MRSLEPIQRSEPRVVEFFGLPGAGKSAVSHSLARRLRLAGRRVAEPTFELVHTLGPTARRLRKGAYIFQEFARRPVASLQQAAKIASLPQRSYWEAVKTAMNWIMVTSFFRKHGDPNSVLLLDQGVCQAAWSVYVGTGSRGWPARAALQPVLDPPFPIAVVVVAADLPTVQRRFTGRHPQSRMEGVTAFDGRAEHVFQELRDILVASRGDRLQVVVVDNGDGVDPDGLAEWVEQSLWAVSAGDENGTVIDA